VIGLKVKIRSKGARDGLARLKKGVGKALSEGVFEAAQHVEGEIKSEVLRTFPHGRTGELMNSFQAQLVRKSFGRIAAGAYSDLIYARIQNEGGPPIRPRDKKYLSIPLRKLPVGKWPRHFPRKFLTCIKSKKGNLILAHITKAKKIQPYYLLRKSITITGRRYLERAARNAEQGVEQILGRRVDLAVSKDGVGT
jgi:hypothetical protein